MQGAVIVTDTNMALAGISKPTLARLGGEAHCFMAESFIADAAREQGTTRAAVSMDRALREYPKAVLAVGNAPTALLRIVELLEAGARPALVIGVPVGFVNVVESKERLRKLGFRTAAMALRDDSVSIDDSRLRAEEKLAIVLGTEGDGLASATIADCDYTVRIPMAHGVDSLNVAAASAVAFWQLRAR